MRQHVGSYTSSSIPNLTKHADSSKEVSSNGNVPSSAMSLPFMLSSEDSKEASLKSQVLMQVILLLLYHHNLGK